MRKNNNLDKNKATKTILILIILVVLTFVLEKIFLNDVTKVQGIKIGLYNVFIILTIIKLSPKYGFILFAAKLVTGIAFASTAVLYPFFGGVLSISAMIIANKTLSKQIGCIGLGIIGALTYNISIYIIAAISLSSFAVFYNLAGVLFLSVLYGGTTGGLAFLLSASNILVRKDGGNNENE